MHKRLIAIAVAAIFLCALILLAISRFNWNPSALLHVSRNFGEAYKVPSGIVLYEDSGYDGMLYYQIARDIPEIFTGAPVYDSPYRWQRILLPALAFFFSFGNDSALPFVILAINVLSVLGALLLFLKMAGHMSIHALTTIANPAALIGILFSLTEPLALFFTTLFLFLWKKTGERVTWHGALTLALAMLARETTLLLILPLFLFLSFSHLKERRKNLFLLGISLLPFAFWTVFLSLHFDTLPWTMGEGMLAVPFFGIVTLARNLLDAPNAYILSSATFFLLFILPLFLLLLQQWQKGRSASSSMMLLTVLLLALFSLDAHIWGVLTSVGRVIPALYPVYALFAIEHDTWRTRVLSSMLVATSIVAACGVALTPHPFTTS